MIEKTMLRNFLIVITLLMMSSFQTSDSHWRTIQESIEKGDASKLSSFFSSKITLSIPGHQGNYSNNQARTIMHSFFSDHPPRELILKTSGDKANASKFYLCQYKTTHDGSFTMYLLVRTNLKSPEIIQLTIEKSS